jgi:hypothetical protein
MANDVSRTIDLLSQLSLPDRYERLVERLGSEVVNVLVPPASRENDAILALAQEVRTRDEGILVPLFAKSGTGKTTFASNLVNWHPSEFTSTLVYEELVTYDAMTSKLREFTNSLPANEYRIVPIVLDHRESAPPTDAELASIKRFLRTKPAKLSTLILWPETNIENARSIAERYKTIAGDTSIELPLCLEGPDRKTWKDIALNTLHLANSVESLENLGVDPQDYDESEYHSIGVFLRRISTDFNRQLQELRKSFQKPIRVAIVFVSQSPEPGVLAQLTNPSRYGLLNPHSLVAVTSGSEMGRWWNDRRGLLTRLVIQLNAHAFCLAPATTVAIVRNCGPVDNQALENAGVKRYGPAFAAKNLGRSDLGKFLLRKTIDRFEARGFPTEVASQAFQVLANAGFNLGKDKPLNKIMADAGKKLLEDNNVSYEKTTAEESLIFCRLIPDNAFHFDDHISCIEFTWRKGEFLSSSNRADVAEYILNKLQKYARQLRWTSD